MRMYSKCRRDTSVVPLPDGITSICLSQKDTGQSILLISDRIPSEEQDRLAAYWRAEKDTATLLK